MIRACAERSFVKLLRQTTQTKEHFADHRVMDDLHVTMLCPQARNKEQEAEVLQWIEDVTGEKLPSQPYEDVLRDGVILCNLINKIAPGSVKKIQTKGTNFQLMENIQRYCQHLLQSELLPIFGRKKYKLFWWNLESVQDKRSASRYGRFIHK